MKWTINPRTQHFVWKSDSSCKVQAKATKEYSVGPIRQHWIVQIQSKVAYDTRRAAWTKRTIVWAKDGFEEVEVDVMRNCNLKWKAQDQTSKEVNQGDFDSLIRHDSRTWAREIAYQVRTTRPVS